MERSRAASCLGASLSARTPRTVDVARSSATCSHRNRALVGACMGVEMFIVDRSKLAGVRHFLPPLLSDL